MRSPVVLTEALINLGERNYFSWMPHFAKETETPGHIQEGRCSQHSPGPRVSTKQRPPYSSPRPPLEPPIPRSRAQPPRETKCSLLPLWTQLDQAPEP